MDAIRQRRRGRRPGREEELVVMDAIGNGENNAALPLAGGEPQFLQALRRDLPRKLYRVAFATGATAVAGLVMPLGAAEDVPLSQLPVVFLLVFILFGAVGALYVGSRLEPELAPTPRWREAGVAVYFLCLLLLVAAVSIVGSVDYCELALNFIDN